MGPYGNWEMGRVDLKLLVLTTMDVAGRDKCDRAEDVYRPTKAITARGMNLESWTRTTYDDVNGRYC